MSKAFTRESDESPDEPVLSSRPILPPGAVNYITPDGAEKLRAELARALEEKTQGSQNAAEPRPALHRLDAKIRRLQEILATIVVTAPPAAGRDEIKFGARVMVESDSGEKDSYRIVGVDETDLDRGEISWLSPLARALLKHRVGDRVRFRAPGGEQHLHILKIDYD